MSLFCRHDTVMIRRAHATAWPEHHHKVAWIDEHNVFNYIVCAKCGTTLKALPPTERIFGQPGEA